MPIEPPRPPRSDGETYARRQHQFNLESGLASNVKTGFLGKLQKNVSPVDTPSSSSGLTQPPRFSADARLPNPAILTCNQDLPLRILVKNLSERTQQVYLQMLQIELIGYTKIRAHDIQRTESNSWIITSMSNMAIPIGSSTDAVGTETPINREYWFGKPLPNTVAPTFEACNISRFYELEVRVGLGYGSYKQGMDQLVVLPLRLPVKVFSGIAPPAALLQAMATPYQPVPSQAGLVPQGLVPPQPPRPIPPSPIEASSPQYQLPPQQGISLQTEAAPAYEDAPPSYEDAIAQDMPPVAGPRGAYAPPPVQEGEPRFPGDEKRRSS